MKTRDVPFYPNTPDDTHCFQAAFKIVLKFFLPEKDFSLKELEQMTAKRKGKWTWPLKGMISLKKMDFDVVNMEDFDYRKFSKNPSKYLVEKYGDKVGKIQEKHSYIPQEQEFAKEFVKLFGMQQKLPEIIDIKKHLDKGYLVMCNINSRVLNGLPGYAGHAVVIFDYDENSFYLHDPGLPPRKNRKVPFKRFMKAWAYPDEGAKNITAFRI